MRKRKTIVVADDETHILDLVRLILGEKYRLIMAEDGIETLAAVEKHRPDLVLLDIMMPRLNGFEVCERLKASPETAGIRVAMLSAKAQERDIIQALKLGADHYITKPFDPVAFERKVEELIK